MAAACGSAPVGEGRACAPSGKRRASAPSLQGSAPLAVLNGKVNMYELTGELGKGWRRIGCGCKKAYGCGDLGQEVVESLRLYMHFGDYPVLTSSLAIRMSDESVRSIEAELLLVATRKNKPPGRDVKAAGTIQASDERLIVIMLVFHTEYFTDLVYYLVFDDIDASLSMIKYLPDDHKAACTLAPAFNRISDVGGDYELVLHARCISNEGVLCMCTPESRANPSTGDMDPWKFKGLRFPEEVEEPFSADLVFTFKGKAFWADFSQGCLMYCDLHTCGSVVNFVSIKLPPECKLDLDAISDDEPVNMIRTMGCVGDSIWLVCIHRCYGKCADDYVTIWSLSLAKRQWKQEVRKSAKMIWGLASFKKAGLPRVILDYPVLTADGALCLVLPDPRLEDPSDEFGPVVQRICCIDVRRWEVLWHGCVHDYDTTSPVILPSNFQRLRVPAKWTTKHLAASGKVVIPYCFI